MVTLKIGSRLPNSNLLTIPMIQYINFDQNSLFGLSDRVQTSFIWSKFDIQSAGAIFLKKNPILKSNILRLHLVGSPFHEKILLMAKLSRMWHPG